MRNARIDGVGDASFSVAATLTLYSARVCLSHMNDF